MHRNLNRKRVEGSKELPRAIAKPKYQSECAERHIDVKKALYLPTVTPEIVSPLVVGISPFIGSHVHNSRQGIWSMSLNNTLDESPVRRGPASCETSSIQQSALWQVGNNQVATSSSFSAEVANLLQMPSLSQYVEGIDDLAEPQPNRVAPQASSARIRNERNEGRDGRPPLMAAATNGETALPTKVSDLDADQLSPKRLLQRTSGSRSGGRGGMGRNNCSTPRLGNSGGQNAQGPSPLRVALVNAQRALLDSIARKNQGSASAVVSGGVNQQQASTLKEVIINTKPTTPVAGGLRQGREAAASPTGNNTMSDGTSSVGVRPFPTGGVHAPGAGRSCHQCGGAVKFHEGRRRGASESVSTVSESERVMAEKLQALGRSLRRL